MTGRTVGNYEVLEKLGEGGMGVVYKGRDRRLKRLVALKFLSGKHTNDTSRTRFLKEAQTASALNHPNIITLYDIGEENGEAYIVMEYVDGQPLNRLLPQEGLPAPTAIDYLVQLGEALAAAHAAGVIHRDLKPGNAMVDCHGRIKVLDFGLAKFDPSTSQEVTQTSPITQVGTLLGTAAYVSPEQSLGSEADRRSDIFSLGVVAHELLTGHRPFAGPTPWALLNAICHEPPRLIRDTHPHLPEALEALVSRMLAKRPDDRYQTMDMVVAALRTVRCGLESGPAQTPSSGPDTPDSPTMTGPLPAPSTDYSTSAHEKYSVGVLMFRSLSTDKDDVYLGEAIASEIGRALAGVPGVRVASQLASRRYRDQPGDLEAAVKALHIRYVVGGSVRRAGARIRIIAELDDMVEGTQLWSHNYDRDTQDIFAVHEEVAGAIVAAVGGQLLRVRAEAVVKVPPEQLDASGLVLRAYHFTTQAYHAGGIHEAIDLLRRATRLEPTHAVAHAFLGFYLIQRVVYGSSRQVERDRAEALAAAERAILLGPGEPEVLENAGLVLVHCGKFQKAVQTLRRAVELAPVNLVAWGYLAMELGWAGNEAEMAESHAIVERLLSTAPDHPSAAFWNCFQSGTYTRQGKWEQAACSARRIITLQPRFAPGLSFCANALGCLGRFDEARELAMQLAAVNPTGTQEAYMTELLITCGSPERAEPHIRGLIAAGIFRGDLPWTYPTPHPVSKHPTSPS